MRWNLPGPKGPKYHNRKIETPDGVFDSKKELRRWEELKLLQRAGKISELKRQVPYILIPAQRDPYTKRVIEREVKYVADFVYFERGQYVVEDVKGYKGGGGYAVFTIKRKLMLREFGIRIKEV